MLVKAELVVVNTGPLLALGACGQVELLRALHQHVVVPPEVVSELRRVDSPGRAPAVAGLEASWLELVELRERPAGFLEAYLDDGEAAVIALAQQLGARWVVIDERRGRLAARALRLSVTGSIGILLRAKRHGLIEAVKPCLDSMHSAGVWLHEELIRLALNEAGE